MLLGHFRQLRVKRATEICARKLARLSHGSSSSVRTILARPSVCYQQKRWLFLKQVFWVANNEPSRDVRGQASASLRTKNCQRFIPPRTTEARVAAELSLRACIVHSKSDTLVRTHKRCAKRMPIPIVGRGHAGWMMARMLMLVKQKQSQPAS